MHTQMFLARQSAEADGGAKPAGEEEGDGDEE